jgi:hypothetical protein
MPAKTLTDINKLLNKSIIKLFPGFHPAKRAAMSMSMIICQAIAISIYSLASDVRPVRISSLVGISLF